MLLPRLSLCFSLAGLTLVDLARSTESNPDFSSLPMRAYSLSPPYLDSDMSNRWFEYGGDTIIRTDKYIRLTSARPSQQGWIFSRVPLTATNWEIEVEFRIHGPNHLYGDGFAMWLTKERGTQGPVFGFTDRFEGLGVFVDTYKNNRPGVAFPYVMAMMGDGQTSYDQEHDGKANEIAGCSARGIRDASVPTKARLTYFQDKSLALDLLYKADGSWTNCFALTAPAHNITIPGVSYLGFSSETGELSDNHDIISVSANNLYIRAPRDGDEGVGWNRRPPGSQGRGPYDSKSGSSWTWSFFKVFLFIAVIAGSYAGWTAYRTSQQHSRF